MNEEFENPYMEIKIIYLILGYILILFNSCIVIILFTRIKIREKNIKILKAKLYFLIIFDSISTFLYINKELIFNSLISNIFFGFLSLGAFYLFISFIYEIFNSTEIYVLAKKPKMINKVILAIFLLLINFSFYKIIKNKIFNILELILVLCSNIIVFIYFKKTSKGISKHLLTADFQTKKVYNYLYMINIFCLLIIVFYNITKIILVIMYPNNIIYLELALSLFNYSLKFYAFSLFTLIIFTLSKKSSKQYNEEIITVMNTGVYSN